MTYRPRPISGFPEYLPAVRLLEQGWLDTIRRTFESYGFASIETPAVEELDVLLAKGETDKEIYALRRLQAEPGESETGRLGLHYDLTVPFARYVGQHFNELSFPFKRYQVQKVWRGERPQEGRFREFTQCDIDVINVDSLPLAFDAELPVIILELLAELGVDDVRLHVSNRKILAGFLAGLGITDTAGAVRVLDKLDKIGADGVVAQLGLEETTARRCLALAAIREPGLGFRDKVAALGVTHPLLEEGLTELAQVMAALDGRPALADLSIARGFDYYTGTVYEGRFTGYPGYGSVVAGGRYDDLAGQFINKKLPGVGISLGLSRLFAKLLAEGRLTPGASCPTEVLVVLPSAERHSVAAERARTLRGRGLKVELYHAPQKLGRQLTYAERKGIPYVWFPPFEEGGPDEVRDMGSGVQNVADASIWRPA